jgi:pilus assembly protein Flp/PilA
MKANFLRTLRNLHTDESGQDLIEYAMVAALIASAAVTTLTSVSTAINAEFGRIVTRLNALT